MGMEVGEYSGEKGVLERSGSGPTVMKVLQ
jgi:hypothetical protein